MPWCPRCRTEYRKDFSTCSDCNSDLVEELEEKKEEKPIYDHEVYLTTVTNSIEADLLESLLNSNKIPVLRKYREAGGYLNVYMGNVTSSIDIFVPSKLYGAAKELIEAKAEAESEELLNQAEEIEFVKEETTMQKKRVFRARTIILFLIPGSLFIVLGVIKVIWKLING